MLKQLKMVLLIITVILSEYSCVTKFYPDEKMNIDISFLRIFYALSKVDTFRFVNTHGVQKEFVVTDVDSILSNSKSWFINQGPYKEMYMDIKQVGEDTTSLIRPNRIFVNKNPTTNKNSISIEFNNFIYFDTILPNCNRNIINIKGKYIINYYIFETILDASDESVRSLYISPEEGIIGFKTFADDTFLKIDK
jgi:hypothetical protein